MSGDPVSVAELSRIVQVEEKDVELAIQCLTNRFEGTGLNLQNVAGGWQITTVSRYAEYVTRLLTRTATRLSRAALETLAIVAYRQPVTAPEIEAVRGVAASGVLRTLLERGLIAESGKKMVPGRPMQYVTTTDFLRYFGLTDLSQLPPLEIKEGSALVVDAAEVVDGIPSEECGTADGRDQPAR